MPIELTERQRRLIDAALILAVIALGFVVLTDLAGVFYAFGDVLLLFFLAWLLSFALLPLIRGVASVIPRMPQAGAVIIVYLAIVALLLAVVVQASASLATSIGQFIQDAPRFEEQLQNLLTQVEAQLTSLGFQVDLASQAPIIVENLQSWALQLVGPLQSLAFASIGVFGNVLLLVILSIYIAIDRAAIVAFLYRLVPPGFVTEARLLQTSVSKSFGGFLRGQLVMGVVFGVFTAIVNIVFGLEYAALTTVAAGLLHAIPFFGPFVSWLPPVAVALLFDPSAVLPGADRDGHRVVRDDERHLPADDVRRGRHPPDRGPRLGRHRRQDRGRRGRDLRHPDRGRPVGVLLPLVRPVARERDRDRPGDQTPGPTRGPRRQAATRAGPGRRRGRRRGRGRSRGVVVGVGRRRGARARLGTCARACPTSAPAAEGER